MTISTAVVETLETYVPRENIHLQEPLSEHTTFRLGGPADCLIELQDTQQVKDVHRYLNLIGMPYTVLGNGSNVLVGDGGYRGVILLIGRQMSRIVVQGNTIYAEAGARLSQIAQAALRHGLTGLEFAAGIPGTVGGGIVMNAGAYDGELSQVVSNVTVLNQESELMELDNETMEFGYRTSMLKGLPFIVTEAEFRLQPGDPAQIAARMEELAAARREKQPLEYPSAGSTFKRPKGYYAGELIMKSGMRGFQIGGARVSDKHCGFVINVGNAVSADVVDVIREVQEKVKSRYQVKLEPEVIFLGEF